MRNKRMNLARHAVKGLGVFSWVVLPVGLTPVAVMAGKAPETAQSILVLALGIFFAALLLRIGAAAVAQPSRRRALCVLLISVGLWAAGSAVLNGTAQPDLTRFPAPGEWLFLASYVGMAGYLIIDTAQRFSKTLSTWLETAVICGGTACLAGSLLLTPVATAFGKDGLPLLLALLYPLIDLTLGLLVIAQVALRARAGVRQAGGLFLGFALFAYADAQFVTNLSTGTYDFTIVSIACWGLGFAFIVGNACRRPSALLRAVPRRQGPALMVVAGTVAILVLVLRPPGGVGPYLDAPAVITLLAAGGRLVLALRQANQAAEAFALSRSDDLTLLPNRRAVLARLDEGLASAAPMALMILDLNGFKDVNDTLGHVAGDSVLQLVGHRMRTALPSDIMIARLGGDEFAAVVPGNDSIELMETAQLILQALREPLLVDGIELATDASIGITVRADADATSTELLRRADVAMYQAKLTRSGALLYDAHSDDFSRQKLQLAEELRKGIADRQLVLWYQPQIDAATQQVCGLEALVRWRHPEQGLLSPAVFLPAARRAGLMLLLSEDVARIAVADLKRWRSHGLDLRIALNCAPPELMSGVFLPRLYETLRKADVPAESLVIEVTEDSFIAEPERARAILLDIREHNLQISIDDYGTGFSSLSYLRDLPVQELKMDRSFISTMRSDPRSRMIVASTLQMAQALELRTVAEGVEDSATAADLVQMGVDVLQGYHLARPIPPNEVESWLAQWTSFSDERLGSQPVDRGAAWQPGKAS
jgi:diguanylate cyclase (GGDEF)-like protein